MIYAGSRAAEYATIMLSRQAGQAAKMCLDPVCLGCCALQIGQLQMPAEFDSHFASFYRAFTQQLVQILPPNTNVQAAYENGTDDQQVFVQNLGLFYTGFLKVSCWEVSGLCSRGVRHQCCPAATAQ